MSAQTVLARAMLKLGFVPLAELDRAYQEGRIDGQHDVTDMCRSQVEAVRAQYAGIERHRDALIKAIADVRAFLPLPPIIIKRADK